MIQKILNQLKRMKMERKINSDSEFDNLNVMEEMDTGLFPISDFPQNNNNNLSDNTQDLMSYMLFSSENIGLNMINNNSKKILLNVNINESQKTFYLRTEICSHRELLNRVVDKINRAEKFNKLNLQPQDIEIKLKDPISDKLIHIVDDNDVVEIFQLEEPEINITWNAPETNETQTQTQTQTPNHLNGKVPIFNNVDYNEIIMGMFSTPDFFRKKF